MGFIENQRIYSFIMKRAFKDYLLSRIDDSILESTLTNFGKKDLGLYIHIPFCRGFCKYCPYTKFRWNRDKAEIYLKALKKEIMRYAAFVNGAKIIDLYVGGGTPSLLKGNDYQNILDLLKANFNLNADLSIEANPEDINERKIDELLNAGVKRISLGIQSLNPKYLKLLGRRYRVETAKKAIETTLSAGFEMVNVDLLYCLPGQNISELMEDIKGILEFGPPQITTYPLLPIPKTQIFKDLKSGKILPQPNRKKDKEMFYTLIDLLLAAGYRHDRIYIFNKEEKESYESTNIEMEGDYIGLGCGSFSCIGGLEYTNTHFIDEYIHLINSSSWPITVGKRLSKEERRWKWFISRLCSFKVEEEAFKKLFAEEFNKHFGLISFLTNIFGIVKKNKNSIEVTQRGKYAVNTAIWSFVEDIVCNINEKCQATPMPDEIRL
jgi:oxygen-independent coproporphyrinogen-3 oxidase